eukprot:jgi/Tetstr1/435569/TSEL_024472.t1
MQFKPSTEASSFDCVPIKPISSERVGALRCTGQLWQAHPPTSPAGTSGRAPVQRGAMPPTAMPAPAALAGLRSFPTAPAGALSPFAARPARRGRLTLGAACCLGRPPTTEPTTSALPEALGNVCVALGVLALLGSVRPARTLQMRMQRRGGHHNTGGPPKTATQPAVTFGYEQALARYRAEAAQEGASQLQLALPEHYPSCRPGTLPLRCRTEVHEMGMENKLHLMHSWLAAAAREVGRADGSKPTSVLDSVWERRADGMLRRLTAERKRVVEEGHGIRRTHRGRGSVAHADANGGGLPGLDLSPRRHEQPGPRATWDEGGLLSPGGSQVIEASESRVGDRYQAAPPLRRPRPDKMTPAEAAWLTRRGCQLDDVASSAPGGDAEVLARVQAQQPGDAAELGLVGPPAALMEGWDAAEVDVFRAGLVQLGRCFEDIAAALNSMVGCTGEAAKRARGMDTLRRLLEEEDSAQVLGALPPREARPFSVARLIGFYYNVWKNRGCAQARHYYAVRALERGGGSDDEVLIVSEKPPPSKQPASAAVAVAAVAGPRPGATRANPSKNVEVRERGPVLNGQGKPGMLRAPPPEALVDAARAFARSPTQLSAACSQSQANGFVRVRKVVRMRHFPHWPHPAPLAGTATGRGPGRTAAVAALHARPVAGKRPASEPAGGRPDKVARAGAGTEPGTEPGTERWD